MLSVDLRIDWVTCACYWSKAELSVKHLIDIWSLSDIQLVQTARRRKPVCNEFIVAAANQVILLMTQSRINDGDPARIDGWASYDALAPSVGPIVVRELAWTVAVWASETGRANDAASYVHRSAVYASKCVDQNVDFKQHKYEIRPCFVLK